MNSLLKRRVAKLEEDYRKREAQARSSAEMAAFNDRLTELTDEELEMLNSMAAKIQSRQHIGLGEPEQSLLRRVGIIAHVK